LAIASSSSCRTALFSSFSSSSSFAWQHMMQWNSWLICFLAQQRYDIIGADLCHSFLFHQKPCIIIAIFSSGYMVIMIKTWIWLSRSIVSPKSFLSATIFERSKLRRSSNLVFHSHTPLSTFQEEIKATSQQKDVILIAANLTSA
jgi:hypothetical protein